VQEVHTGRDLAVVLFGAAVVVAIAAGGLIGRSHYNLPWAPFAGGGVIAMGLFAVMEITYRPVRARLKAGRDV
jgi:hypothetical protein